MEKSQQSLRKVEKFAFLSGALGKDILYLYMSLFLMFYFTNILGISAAVAGMIMLVVRVFDACFDVWFGISIDKVKSKWGRFRPFLLFGAIPYAVIAVVLFLGPNLSTTGKIVYAFCLYLFYSVLYSVVSIPHAALNSVLTNDTNERAKLSSMLVFGSTIGSVICSCFTPLLVPLFPSPRIGYMACSGIFATISAAALLFCFFNTKERTITADSATSAKEPEKISLAKSFQLIFKNVDFLLLSVSYLLVQVCVGVSLTIGVYYFMYYVKNFALYSPVNMCGSIGSLVFLLVSAPVLMKVGKKNLFLIGALAMLLAKVAYYFVPNNNYVMIILLFIVIKIATSSLIVSSWSALPDTTDLTTKRDGVHMEGLMYSVFNFFQKVGSSLAAAITGFILAAYGYQSGAAHQTASGVHGVLVGNSLLSGAIILIPLILMLFFNVSKKLVKYNTPSTSAEKA